MNKNMSEIWDQAYELYADLEDLNDEELLEVRLNMKGRAKSIMRLAGVNYDSI